MSDCLEIDPLVTPYVDGELGSTDRQLVDGHLERCSACRARISVERGACDLLQRRKAELKQDCAPLSLRRRCGARPEAAVVAFPARTPPASRFTVSRLAVAAALLVLVVGALAYRATLGATEALAAELTADHVKCFMLNTVLRTHESVSDVRAYLRSGFDWEAELPAPGTAADLSLVGSRPCLYERGKVAHIMYRHKGLPVSVFMLPGTHYPSELLHTFGHEAVIWTDGGRTFVLIARASPDEVAKVASFVQEALH